MLQSNHDNKHICVLKDPVLFNTWSKSRARNFCKSEISQNTNYTVKV